MHHCSYCHLHRQQGLDPFERHESESEMRPFSAGHPWQFGQKPIWTCAIGRDQDAKSRSKHAMDPWSWLDTLCRDADISSCCSTRCRSNVFWACSWLPGREGDTSLWRWAGRANQGDEASVLVHVSCNLAWIPVNDPKLCQLRDLHHRNQLDNWRWSSMEVTHLWSCKELLGSPTVLLGWMACDRAMGYRLRSQQDDR